MTTPTKFFLCARNMADEALITPSVAAYASLPASNLRRSSRSRVWRSSSAASVDLLFTWSNTSNSERINFVSLSRYNLEPAATWRVRAYPTVDGSGAASYDSGTVAAYDAATLGSLDFGVAPLGSGAFDAFLGQMASVFYFIENTATVINSVRITITDTTNSAGYVEASRAYIGRGIELAYNPKTLRMRWNEDTQQERSDGGTLTSDGSLAFREIGADLEWVTAAQRAELMDMCRWAGMRKDWYISARPGVGGEEERDHQMICRATQMPEMSTLLYNTWSSQFKFAET